MGVLRKVGSVVMPRLLIDNPLLGISFQLFHAVQDYFLLSEDKNVTISLTPVYLSRVFLVIPFICAFSFHNLICSKWYVYVQCH